MIVSLPIAILWFLGSFGLGVLSGYAYGYTRSYNYLLDYLRDLKEK